MTDRVAMPRLGVSVCVWRGDDILLVKRGKPPAFGRWSPVGGMVEFGETLAEACRREVREEAGLEVDVVGRADVREILLREPARLDVAVHIVLVVHAAIWRAGVARAGDDAADVAWTDTAGLARFDLVEGIVPYILGSRRLITSA